MLTMTKVQSRRDFVWRFRRAIAIRQPFAMFSEGVQQTRLSFLGRKFLRNYHRHHHLLHNPHCHLVWIRTYSLLPPLTKSSWGRCEGLFSARITVFNRGNAFTNIRLWLHSFPAEKGLMELFTSHFQPLKCSLSLSTVIGLWWTLSSWPHFRVTPSLFIPGIAWNSIAH